MKNTIKSAINAINKAPRHRNGGVLWVADPKLMAKVAVAIIGSGDMLAAIEQITSSTGVTEQTMRLFIRGKDVKNKSCKVISDGLSAAGLSQVEFIPRPRKSASSAAKNSARETERPGTHGRDYVVEAWSLKELRDALACARNECEEAKDILIQRTTDMVDSCESYVQAFNEAASQFSHPEDPFSVIEKTGLPCMEVINMSIATNSAVVAWNKAVKHLRDLLGDYKILRASRWPFLPELTD